MQEWKNRIVGYEEKDPAELKANPLNWRTHPKNQEKALEGVLDEVGLVQNIVFNKATGHLIDGHLRVELAIKQKQEKVPVTMVELTEDEERLILATLDPLGAMANANADKLQELIAQVDTQNESIKELLADLEIEHPVETEPGEAPEPKIDLADELQEKWKTEIGQLWEIGGHRLLIGDCAKDSPIIFYKDKYALLVTDPPYGVSYASKNEFLNNLDEGNRCQSEIDGDHQSPEEMEQFWIDAFSAIRKCAKDGASYYITGPQGGDLLLLLLQSLRQSKFPLRHMLIWAKNNHVLGRSDYNYKHEPIIYGWVNGSHKFYGGSSEVSLWEIDKPLKSEHHPTMKPVELFARAVKNSSLRGDIVCDPFLGSGTTMIACEQLGRKCYGIEIEPKYAAVTLERMLELGVEGKLIGE